MIQIPFNYKKSGKYLGYLIHDTFNDGITLCRKLGFEPKIIYIGEEEKKQTDCFEPSLEKFFDWQKEMSEKIKTQLPIGFNYPRINIEIVYTNNPTEITFYCE